MVLTLDYDSMCSETDFVVTSYDKSRQAVTIYDKLQQVALSCDKL